MWKILNHPNILRFIGVQTIGNQQFLLSPWMVNGSLAHYLRENPSADRGRLVSHVNIWGSVNLRSVF